MKRYLEEMSTEDYIFCGIILMLFGVRIAAFFDLGISYNLNSDDASYIVSGLHFAKTGELTMHGVRSAQIMPLMTWILAFLSIFGRTFEGTLILGRLLMITLGVASAGGIYGIIRMYANPIFGYMGMMFFILPTYIWMDNLVLTESAFQFAFVFSIYYVLKLAKSRSIADLLRCSFFYMFGFLLKANFGVFPAFAFLYLLIEKYPVKLWFKHGIIMFTILLAFLVPWTIRNYYHFGHIVPTTYGAGNPTLLGTYQGYGYPDPSRDEKFLASIVDDFDKAREGYYNHDTGIYSPAYMGKFFDLEHDSLFAKARLNAWRSEDLRSYVISTFYYKPSEMVETQFYWQPVFGIEKLSDFQPIIIKIGIMTSIAGFIFSKKIRSLMFLLGSLYYGNLVIYSFTFAFSRYSATLHFLMVIALMVGLGTLYEYLKRKVKARNENLINNTSV